jgi:predicted secreted protein
MALSAVLSKELSIYQGTNAIAFATDFSLEINKAAVDITTLSASGWKAYLVDLKEWKISVSGLMTRGTTVGSQVGSEQLITSLLGTDTALTCQVKTAVTGDQYVTGSAYLTAIKESGSVGDSVKVTYEFQGTGTLSTATV